MTTLMAASKQWMKRPSDQRFTDLEALRSSVANRKNESWTVATNVNDIRVSHHGADTISLDVYDPAHGERRMIEPTNFAFGQLSQYAQAPASYLRTLPAPLAAINLQYGLDFRPLRPSGLVLGQTNGSNMLRSITSTSYGRIWDQEVVDAVIRVNHDGKWKVPSSSSATTNPQRATTLYASDRDVFIFLVDEANPIDIDGEILFRGFYTWNSEVGASVFGLTTFLYRYMCDNRIIWGATNVDELRIRHTGGAPERFLYEGAQYLQRYANESDRQVVDGIRAAKQFEIKKEEGWEDWLNRRGFTKSETANAISYANAEEGQARSLWDIINGLTASARAIENTDRRVELETKAGSLMKFASK